MGMTNTSFGIVVTYPDRKEDNTIREIVGGYKSTVLATLFS